MGNPQDIALNETSRVKEHIQHSMFSKERNKNIHVYVFAYLKKTQEG